MIDLFKAAFPDDNGVQLWIKSLPDHNIKDPLDSRIRIFKDYLSEDEMAKWYGRSHCFVSVSTSEGWGFMRANP